jgi:D-alanyl-D-alanine carboxypeptidase
MNRKCRHMNMKDTVYTNPHGMDENNNRSTAFD